LHYGNLAERSSASLLPVYPFLTSNMAPSFQSNTFTDAELVEITGGYLRQADQLRVLRGRGFYRAEIMRGRLVLERSHYDAVTRGLAAQAKPDERRPMLRSQRHKAPA
jgi:hypothetical protein